MDQGKFNVLGIEVNAIDYDTTVEHVIAAAKARAPLTLSALAVHGVMTGALDPEQGYRLNHLDLVVPDGQPVRWALNLLHSANLSDRVYGPTLMLRICDRAASEGLPIYLYGSRETVLAALVKNLQRRFPGLRVAGYTPSQFKQVTATEQRQIAAAIVASGAQIVFVGLGCPRQEVWVYENRDLLAIPAIAVGAAFDFHAGLLPQAPTWMQKYGLEWLFRLGQEPGRLWRRYVLLNPQYLWLLMLQWLHLRRFDQPLPQPPEPLRYS